jgi:hypothetical protein
VADDGRPFLRVIRGDASDEEIAAIVATLAAVAAARKRGAENTEQAPVKSQWAARSRPMRAPVRPAPGGWRRSALP